MQIKILLSLGLIIAVTYSQCTHKIFCYQPILQAAADSKLFSDSKTFVDLTLKVPIEEALNNFKTQNPVEFIQSNFHLDPNILLVQAQFEDYQENPAILDRIQDQQLRKFAAELNRRWNLLGKKVDFSRIGTVGTCKQNCSSFLPEVENFTMLVPGGRFRESYYWDTYWIILGLIASDMLSTAEMLLDNFAAIINRYGFIPNGFRVYYLNRSQPPYFFMMVKSVAQALIKKGMIERAAALTKRMFDVLDKEHEYWQKTHSLTAYIDGTVQKINQYRANTKSPRPESFKQDMQTTSKIIDSFEKERIFMCLSSVAESGWDFSSRWLKNDTLSTTDIDQNVPSDLVALLGMMQKYLAEVSTTYGRTDLTEKYLRRYKERVEYFRIIKKYDRFPDFQLVRPTTMPDIIYPTDYLPYLLLQQEYSMASVYQDVVNPESSPLRTGQQWDAPNVWAPNNWIIHEIAPREQAKKYATQWVQTTYCSYKKHNSLFEKYKNSQLGERGEGGEYQNQIGFGWTNGLALHYLSLYPDLVSPEC